MREGCLSFRRSWLTHILKRMKTILTESLEFRIVGIRRRRGEDVYESVGVEELENQEISLSEGESLERNERVGRNIEGEKREQED